MQEGSVMVNDVEYKSDLEPEMFVISGVRAQHEVEKRKDPEVSEKPIRRKYSTEYKLRILKEADSCIEPGQIGALLRREGLYSSNLTTWRRQRDRGMLEGLRPKKRGRKEKPLDPRDRHIRELQRENEKLRKRLKQADTIIEFQKKLCEVLKIPLKESIEEDR